MKILVISDTHRRIANAVMLIERLNPDYIYHLGDLCEDCHELESLYPRKVIVAVKGNNDFFDKSYPSERCFEIDGKKIFMCHGHKYNVKTSLMALLYKAKELGADIALYGHTHIAHLEEADGVTLMNPGSILGYGIIEINDGKMDVRVEKYAD